MVTVYDLELKTLSLSNPSKNAILSGKKRNLRFIFFNFFLVRIVRSLKKMKFQHLRYIFLLGLNLMVFFIEKSYKVEHKHDLLLVLCHQTNDFHVAQCRDIHHHVPHVLQQVLLPPHPLHVQE